MAIYQRMVEDISEVDITKGLSENYIKNQGRRHPRTAIAVTENKKVLLITVDGRFPESAGMTAYEPARFIATYFNPQYALNLDGGGSTTQWIKGKTHKGVVNYPSDNGKRDYLGQRRVRTFILVKKNVL